MTERTYVLCEDCHRVLWAEDGPVCPGCLEIRAKQKRVTESVPVHWAPERQQIVEGDEPEDACES